MRRRRGAGREPAEDVKRRIVDAGRAAGFKKGTARMFLRGDGRVVYVRLVRRRGCGSAEVTGFVGTDGSFCGHVRIAATLGSDDDRMAFRAMNMHGREAVPLRRIREEMEAVAGEMGKVESAADSGDHSPWMFGDVLWGAPIDTQRGFFGG